MEDLKATKEEGEALLNGLEFNKESLAETSRILSGLLKKRPTK